jgi:hypothetical protein
VAVVGLAIDEQREALLEAQCSAGAVGELFLERAGHDG